MSRGGETGGSLVSPFTADQVRKQEKLLFPLPLTPSWFMCLLFF